MQRWRNSRHAHGLRGKARHKDTASPAFAKIAETFKTEKDFYSATYGERYSR